jgi:hypothetical protein
LVWSAVVWSVISSQHRRNKEGPCIPDLKQFCLNRLVYANSALGVVWLLCGSVRRLFERFAAGWRLHVTVAPHSRTVVSLEVLCYFNQSLCAACRCVNAKRRRNSNDLRNEDVTSFGMLCRYFNDM